MITVDQIVSGASNVLAAVLAARILSISDFGVFTIVFLVYVTAQGIARALVGSPLLVHPKEAEERPGDAMSAAVLVGVLLGLVVVISGLVVDALSLQGGASLIVLGICLPLLGLQDVGRFLGFAIQRPGLSLFLDTLWLVLMVPALAFIILEHHRTLTWFTIVWAGCGAAAGLVMVWRYLRSDITPPMSWLRETWPYAWRYVASFATNQGSTLIASLGLTAIGGSAIVGALRGAQLLQRPIGAVQSGGVAAGIAEISRIDPPTRPVVARETRKVTLLLSAAALANLVVLAFLPDVLGRAVLGDSWHSAKGLLLPLDVQIFLLCITSGAQAALLGLKFIRLTLRIDIMTIVIMVVPPLVSTSIGGIVAGAWTLAAAQGIALLVWWGAYLRVDVTAPPLQHPAQSLG